MAAESGEQPPRFDLDEFMEPLPETQAPHTGNPNGEHRGHQHAGDDELEAPQNAAKPEVLTLDQMLSRFVHVARGPMVIDLANISRRMRPGEFAAAYGHLRTMVGKRAISLTNLWSESDQRMVADRLTFNPGEAQFFTDQALTHLNIWQRPAWAAVDVELASAFIDHIAYLIPDEAQRNDLLDWLAHAAQRPEIRPHHHFLLVAAQEGTGRSWLVEVLRRIWGERHAAETDLHRLLDDPFNSLLSAKVMVAVHEVKAPADERYSHRDRLKSLLTDSSITINEKHEPRWTEKFVARFLMFTNRDDALPLSESDRRVYAVRCADTPRDPGYYTALYAKLDDHQFLGAVWHLLTQRNLSAFNPGRRAPLNEMKVQVIAAGRTEEQQSAADFVKACPHAIVAGTDLFRVLVPELEGERLGDHKGRVNAVAAVLREMGAQTVPKKVSVDGRATRLWILRQPGAWIATTPAKQRTEAEATRKDLVAAGWLVDVAVEGWGRRA